MKRFISCVVFIAFITSLVAPYKTSWADQGGLSLPEPGVMVNLSPAYEPVMMKGLKIDPKNPFRFEFILDTGDENTTDIKSESTKLIKYFLASLTIPEKDLWVNLSPYEKDRMIASNLAQTEMGRDMLAQDYILKQLTASLIYPEKDLGKAFWDKVYSKAQALYGTTTVPVNTFNKVWIVADKADVFERGNVAYVVGAHLKVMLEGDYLSMSKHNVGADLRVRPKQRVDTQVDPYDEKQTNAIGSQIVREIVLPALEQEINTGKNFAPLRQMFYSMILASWYKMALKDAVLTQVYGNQSKVKVGVNQQDPKTNDEIFNKYLKAYKKGVFNYIKEDIDQSTQQPVPRKYFSGGEKVWGELDHARVVHTVTAGTTFPDQAFIARVDVSPKFARSETSQDAAMVNNIEAIYNKRLDPIVKIRWSQLSDDSRKIIEEFGISDDFVELIKSCYKPFDVITLILPEFRKIFTDKEISFLKYGIFEMAKASQGNGASLLSVIPELKRRFSSSQLYEYWPIFIELSKKSKSKTTALFVSIANYKKIIDSKETLLLLGEKLIETVETIGIERFRKLERYLHNGGGSDYEAYWLIHLELLMIGVYYEGILIQNNLVIKSAFGEQANEYLKDLYRLIRVHKIVPSDFLTKWGQLFTSEQIKECWTAILASVEKPIPTLIFTKILPLVKSRIHSSKDLIFWVNKFSDLIKITNDENYNRMVNFFQITGILNFISCEDVMSWVNKFSDFIKITNDYNRDRISTLFKETDIFNFIFSKQGDALHHFDFYLEIIQQNPRLAFQVLEGLFESIKNGQISIKLPQEEQQKILEFIKQSKAFNPVFYSFYLKEGLEGLKDVEILTKKVIEDNLSPADIESERMRFDGKGYQGDEIVIASIQQAIPSSGASFVSRAEIKGLFNRYLEAGDHREDVPKILRAKGNFGGGEIDQSEWQLKEGEQFDSQGKLKSVLEQLHYPDSGKEKGAIKIETEKDKQELIKQFESYLKERSNENRAKVLRAFLAYVRHNDLLKEKIDAIKANDYMSLSLLEQLFVDKDNLSILFREIIEKNIDPNLLKEQGRELVLDPSAIKKRLEGVWNNVNLTEDKKIFIIQGILKNYDSQNIRETVFPFLPAGSVLLEVVKTILSGKLQTTISTHRLIEELFKEPLVVIQNEKNKFEKILSNQKIKLSFRAVKGVPYGLWGLCAGVCVATDIEMWKDPNFFLLAMIDENTNQAVGFIHLYQKILKDGQRILTVPGLEPSTEFLSTVKAQEIYPMIINALREVAKAENYQAIYLPTNENILSNRSEINKLIKQNNYEKIHLDDEVQWNHLPSPYPFKEVYVVASKARQQESKVDLAMTGEKVWGESDHARVVHTVPAGTTLPDQAVIATVNVTPTKTKQELHLVPDTQDAAMGVQPISQSKEPLKVWTNEFPPDWNPDSQRDLIVTFDNPEDQGRTVSMRFYSPYKNRIVAKIFLENAETGWIWMDIEEESLKIINFYPFNNGRIWLNLEGKHYGQSMISIISRLAQLMKKKTLSNDGSQNPKLIDAYRKNFADEIKLQGVWQKFEDIRGLYDYKNVGTLTVSGVLRKKETIFTLDFRYLKDNQYQVLGVYDPIAVELSFKPMIVEIDENGVIKPVTEKDHPIYQKGSLQIVGYGKDILVRGEPRPIPLDFTVTMAQDAAMSITQSSVTTPSDNRLGLKLVQKLSAQEANDLEQSVVGSLGLEKPAMGRYEEARVYKQTDIVHYFVKPTPLYHPTNIAFIRLGNLFLIDQGVYRNLDENLRQKYANNFIIIPKMKEQHWADSEDRLKYFASTTIMAMMQIDLQGKRFLDVGAGDGILSVIANKLGASELVMIEKDAPQILYLKELLQANGIQLNEGAHIIQGDILQPVSIIDSWKSSQLETIATVSIGTWPVNYGNTTNLTGLRLLSFLPEQERKKISNIILGGYMWGQFTMRGISDLHNQENQYAKDKLGLTLRPGAASVGDMFSVIFDRAQIAQLPSLEDLMSEETVLTMSFTNTKDNDARIDLVFDFSSYRLIIIKNGKELGSIRLYVSEDHTLTTDHFFPHLGNNAGYSKWIVAALAQVARHYGWKMKNSGTHNPALIEAFKEVFGDEIFMESSYRWSPIPKAGFYDKNIVGRVLIGPKELDLKEEGGYKGTIELGLTHISGDQYRIDFPNQWEIPNIQLIIDHKGIVQEVLEDNQQIKQQLLGKQVRDYLGPHTIKIRGTPKDIGLTFDISTEKYHVREHLGKKEYRAAEAMASAPGGIDLNSSKMQMNVSKEGEGIQMQFPARGWSVFGGDPAMVEKIKREGFDGLEFTIQSIKPVVNLPLLLGLRPEEEVKLAKV